MYLQKSENQDIEFKQSWHDEYLKWICAFANTSGGLLYIGVSDNGEICGVTESHKLTEDIPNKIRHTMGLICDIQLLNDNDRKYLKIAVEKYPFPVSYHGKYYKRSGSTIQELNGAELNKMMLSVQGGTWDTIPIPNVKVSDLENDAFRLFRKKASDSGRLDNVALEVSNETLIKNLYLSEGDYLTRAAILAFHPDPERWITGAYIKIGFFVNEADILYQDEVHGPLLLQVEKSIELIYSKYMKALISYNDIYRKEENAKIPEIDLSLGGITARCYASNYYIELMSEHNEVNEVNISENIANNCPKIAQRLPRDCPENIFVYKKQPNCNN